MGSGGSQRFERARNTLDICFGIGLSVATTAWVIRESEHVVWHEWSVRTGEPTPDDPPASVIAERSLEIQSGWTQELRQAAEHGCTLRNSSSVCNYRQRKRRETQRIYDAQRKAKQEWHLGSTDARDSRSPSPVIEQQRTWWFSSTACEGTASD